MGDEGVLRIRAIEKRFGARPVLRGVDLDVRPGEILALVGENGAGKSTLVHCVAGSYPPDRGGIGGATDAIEVVWQDLSLCDNLSIVANLFLGNEVGRRVLDDGAMTATARALFSRLQLPISDPLQPVGALSGGQRQLVAIARSLLREPGVLILDEPTASLGVVETAIVERLLIRLRGAGTAILLVSHRLEQVFNLADRIAVLRDGVIVAAVSPLEVHPDDVVAMISGVEVDSTARRQLRLLRSLVDQLAEVEPAATLPLIVSAMAEALAVDRLCVHLLDDGGPTPVLRRSAAVGLDRGLLDVLEALPVGAAGGPVGLAAETAEAVVVDDTRTDPRWTPLRGAGPRSCWSIPIVGADGVLGTISGYADTAGALPSDRLELVSLYASHAAAAIDRERLLAEATRRNRVLETLRGILDTLAGPESSRGGLKVALLALCRGLGADSIAMHQHHGEVTELWATSPGEATVDRGAHRQRSVATALLRSAGRVERARPVGDDILAVPIAAPRGRAVVTAYWADPARLTNDAVDLLDDAARSLRLALEREEFEHANAEAASLRRSQGLQREFLSRLNHELRTPLTAIQGFASTLRQPDVTWDDDSQQRFLDSIASESARMGRLVGDLLDFSAIDSGTLRLVPDWCDLGLVVEAAHRCMPAAAAPLFAIGACDGLPPVWADHDRLEQVFVNLFENAVLHAGDLTAVAVSATLDPDAAEVVVRVTDDGRGIAPDLAERMFLPHERGATEGPGAGLGLAIARGIVEAHGGTIGLEPVARGTSVFVTLPVEPVAAADRATDRAADPAPDRAADRATHRAPT